MATDREGGPVRDQPVTNQQTERTLRWHRYRQLRNGLLAVMVGGTFVITVVWLVGLWLVGPGAMSAFHAEVRPYLHVMRTTVLVGVVAFWPRLIGRLADWLLMGPAFCRVMIAWRWRAALWMILIELVVVYEVPFTFVRRLLGVAP